VRLSWDLKLVGNDDIEEGDSSRRRAIAPTAAATAKSDIGFSVLLQKRNGTLPMLLPYK
jgi:hypothetical protein